MEMAISIFISPLPTWHAGPATSTKLPTKPDAPRQKAWEDHASDLDWQAALLGYLRLHWRGGIRLWTLVNSVVAESLPQDREEVRERTKVVLHALMCLIREKRVLRFKRRLVAILEPPTVIPLEETPLACSGRI